MKSDSPRTLLAAGSLLLLTAPALGTPAPATLPQGGLLDNEGTEFLCGFMPNARGLGAQPPDLELHLTSSVPTTATIVYPAGSASPTFTTTVPVTPGSIEIVGLPVDAAEVWLADQTAANLVSLNSDDEVTAYMINRAPFTSDAALALPVDTLNTEFILADYGTEFTDNQGAFVVFARFDNTDVTITPTAELIGGHLPGVPFTVTLQAGEGYYGRIALAGTSQNLTGTIVESSEVVGVTSGNNCGVVPFGFGFCDHMFEVIQPTQTWGSSYLVANLPNRPAGTVYRAIGSVDGTQILVDGAPAGTVNRGGFLEIGPTVSDSEISSAGGEPFFVVQYMTGSQFGPIEIGDPAMGNCTPPEQYKSEYTFSTVGGAQFLEHWITVIAETGDIGSVLLNGTAIGAGSFSPVGSTVYSVARLNVPEGTYSTSSPNPHGVTVEGFNDDDSYLYPAGARFQFINPVGDANPPICDDDPITGLNVASTVVRDDRPSEDLNGNGALDPGEDLNGDGLIDEDTGIFFIAIDPSSTNLSVTPAAFQPGDASVAVQIDLVDPGQDGAGELVVTDGAGNETRCAVAITADLGTSICSAVPNSTGIPGRTRVQGSTTVADNGLVLVSDRLPAMVWGFYVNSRQEFLVPNPGGSEGNLCIASLEMGRHDANMRITSSTGTASLAVDLAALPFEPGGLTAALAGETWYWQFWHRDDIGAGPTSNFTNAVRVDLQ
ncbi:MAG: IgGFc-binding protein [Planctomycetota bacterium]